MQPLFKYQPPEDESVDGQWIYQPAPRWTIQDARAYSGTYVIAEQSPATEADFWVRHHTEHKTLEAAKLALVKLAAPEVPTAPATIH